MSGGPRTRLRCSRAGWVRVRLLDADTDLDLRPPHLVPPASAPAVMRILTWLGVYRQGRAYVLAEPAGLGRDRDSGWPGRARTGRQGT